MNKFKKCGLAVLLVIAALAVNLIISILLHGFMMAPMKDPFTIEGITEVFEDQADSEILDTLRAGDSALTLIKKADGNVFLLEFHKNLLLNRYQILDVVNIIPEANEEHLPVSTVLRSYSVLIQDHQSLTLETTNPRSFQFSTFFLLYGLNTLLLLLLEFVIFKTSRKLRKNPKKK